MYQPLNHDYQPLNHDTPDEEFRPTGIHWVIVAVFTGAILWVGYTFQL